MFFLYFIFVCIVEARMRANIQRTSMGGMRQEQWEREGHNSGEQKHLEICGRERDGAGNMGNRRWTLQGLSGRKSGNLNEVRSDVEISSTG